MKNGRLESAGMEIRELMQTFCEGPLPECLTSIRIFQDSSDIYVRYYWKHKTPLGEILESETVASLYDYLNEDGSQRFSLDASIIKNAVAFCSDSMVQQNIPKRSYAIDTKDIAEFNKILIDDENTIVKLLSVNKMLTAESKLIIHFYIENKTDSDIRVWLKNITTIYDNNELPGIHLETGYDTEYILIGTLAESECKKCSVILDDKGFFDCDPFADIAKENSENCLSLQIAYDFDEDDDYAETPQLWFGNYMNECWFEDEEDEEDKEDNKDGSEEKAKRVLTYNDIVIRANDFKLAKNYTIEQVIIKIKVLRDDGQLLPKYVPAGYCREKDFYFILEKELSSLSKLGVLMCRIVSQQLFNQVQNGTKVFGLEAESLLHQYGYNVNKRDGLTDIQRQSILKTVIDEEVYTPTGLLSFLGWLIDRNAYQRNKADAIDKWQSDRAYVKQYALSLGLPVVIEDPVIEKERELSRLIADLERKLKND